MKVRHATQLLSKSVGDALEFCKDILYLDEIQSCGPTIHFIRLFNDAFDVLNSRSLKQYGKNRALCNKNINYCKIFLHNFSNYIQNLKFSDGNLVINSNRKTGFLRFLCVLIHYYICIKNLLNPIV